MLTKALFPILALAAAAALWADPELPESAPPPVREEPGPGERKADEEPTPAPDGANRERAPEDEPAGQAPERRKPFSPQEAIKRLGHDEFKVRSGAQEELLEWGTDNLEKGIELLYEVFRSTDDPEIRMRSRQVLRRLVILRQPFEGEGYLGIQMDNTQLHHARGEDGELQPAVLVTMVREGTAAELAKLEEDDLIIGVDDLRFEGPAPNQGIAPNLESTPNKMLQDYIMSKKPGDRITLHVRRNDQTLALAASLRRRSPLLDRLNQFGAPRLDLPPQEELDEADFQDWLKARDEERRREAGNPAPAAP